MNEPDGGPERQSLLNTRQEFARGWKVLFGATFGVGLGISGLLTYNLGLFATDLGRQIGLGPALYGAALLALNVALASAMPFVGRLVDRFGSKTIAATGAAFLSAGFLSLSRIQSVATFVIVLVLIGLAASLSSPVAHTRAVAERFTRRRGLALGITQVGIGLAAALVPPLIAAQIGRTGWRSGFVLLAILAAAGIVPIVLGLPGKMKTGSRTQPQAARLAGPLWPIPAFRLQLAAFTAMAFALIGIIAHFVPMLRASGVSLQQAGALAGSIGLSVIVTRLVVGWLADRIEPAWLGAVSCVICAGGALALALGGASLAFPAALALGCAIGAEADLIGILTARNFPLAAYSRAYSWQYASFTLAAGISPLLIGVLAEATGGYRLPLLLCAALLAIPIFLFVLLALRSDKNFIPGRHHANNS
ncbi:MAG: MFS transporter [Croceibacterium sp.]